MEESIKTRKYIPLKNLEVYKLARELSTVGWEIYESLDWQVKKTIGDQFIEATDSIGANIAEGYSRFHYLDKIKFYYNSRASLSESSNHWLELLLERGKTDKESYDKFKAIANKLSLKLNNFIKITYEAKNNKDNQ